MTYQAHESRHFWSWIHWPFKKSEDGSASSSQLDSDLGVMAGSRCVKGSHRETNEDKSLTDLAHGIFLVADGIGGNAGGAEASRCLVEVIPEHLQEALGDRDITLDQFRVAIEEAFQAARTKMRDEVSQHPEFARMGAAVALVVLRDHHAYIASAGDCRVYLVRGNEVICVTHDQTIAQSLADNGVLTTEQVTHSPYRHVLTNWVGARDTSEAPGIVAMEIQAGDRLLLTTDGLTESLTEADLKAMAHQGSPQEVVDHMVLEALRHDAQDNISCIMLKMIACHTSDRANEHRAN